MYKFFIKRGLDIFFSVLLLILFFPIMLIIILLIRQDGKKSIFVQKRSGKNNIPFDIYKFRTMSIDNNVYDYSCNDKFTKIGRFLKTTSLDELPQLINILKGDMSFIGPRPWILDYSKYYDEYQMKRLSVRPGLTGLAQCNGRNNISVEEKIDYDIKYIKNITFSNDLKIIGMTIKSVLLKEGSTTNKFTIKDELNELKNQSNFKTFTIDNEFTNLSTILERKI